LQKIAQYMSTITQPLRYKREINTETVYQERKYMNTQFKATFTSILVAITVAAASGSVEAGKGNGSGGHGGGGGHSGGYGSGNGAMYGSGPSTGYGYETRNSNQYRYQHQHQHRNGGNSKGNMQAAGSVTGQYSNDRNLDAQDFQAWLHQNQSKAQTMKHNQARNMTRDGL
jgi:hypothetical protein